MGWKDGLVSLIFTAGMAFSLIRGLTKTASKVPEDGFTAELVQVLLR
jgi:hypothetical protein